MQWVIFNCWDLVPHVERVRSLLLDLFALKEGEREQINKYARMEWITIPQWNSNNENLNIEKEREFRTSNQRI